MSTVVDLEKAPTVRSCPTKSESSCSNYKTKLSVDDRTTHSSPTQKSAQDPSSRDCNNNNIINSHNNINNRNNLAAINAHKPITSTAITSSKHFETMSGNQKQMSTDKMATINTECALDPRPSRKTNTSIAKFKEKRPEPLKLNPNINQEIPLDLSVKSAGNIPSGVKGSLFNLALSNQMTTLETPRIQWQDNESFLSLSKSRLFSCTANARLQTRVSSLVGDSPPVTPSSPYMNIIAPTASANRLRSSQPPQPGTENSGHEMTPNAFSSSKYQLLDKLAQTNGSLLRYNQLRNELKRTPRRSCSTDNLNYLCGRGYKSSYLESNTIDDKQTLQSVDSNTHCRVDTSENSIKKNSISPLATKSLSSTEKYQNSKPSAEFSYIHDKNMISDDDDDQRLTNLSRASNRTVSSLSVANATANLLNIHLNSPTRNSDLSPTTSMFDGTSTNHLNLQQQQNNHYQTPTRSSFGDLMVLTGKRSHPELSPLDPLFSATHCHSFTQRTSATSSEQNQQKDQRNSVLHCSYLHQHNTSSLGGSTSLNTPTLISPSQLKSGNLCFLQSPTLSPMSSVFELPSPLLVYSQNQGQSTTVNYFSNNQSQDSASVLRLAGDQNVSANNKIKSDPSSINRENQQEKNVSLECPGPAVFEDGLAKAISDNNLMNFRMSRKDAGNDDICTHSDTDLSSLITSATKKIIKMDDDNDDGRYKDVIAMSVVADDGDFDDAPNDSGEFVEISVENESSNFNPTPDTRPATVIPQIFVTEGSQIDQKQAIESNDTSHSHCPYWTCSTSTQQSRSRSSQQINELARQHGHQRDTSRMRTLSPKSFRSRANLNHNERLESNSAPPSDYQRRPRGKIKTVTSTDSCVELTAAAPIPLKQHQGDICNSVLLQQTTDTHNAQLGQHSHVQQQRSTAGPYRAEVPIWQSTTITAATCAPTKQQGDTPTPHLGTNITAVYSSAGARPCLNGRSSSAEPQRINQQVISPISNSLSNSTTSTLMLHDQQNNGVNFNNVEPSSASNGQIISNYRQRYCDLSYSAQHLKCMAALDSIGLAQSGVGSSGIFNLRQQSSDRQSNAKSQQHTQHHSISVDELNRIASKNPVLHIPLPNQPGPILGPSCGSRGGHVDTFPPSASYDYESTGYQPQQQQQAMIQTERQTFRPIEHYHHDHVNNQLQQQKYQTLWQYTNRSAHLGTTTHELDNQHHYHQATVDDVLVHGINQKLSNIGCDGEVGVLTQTTAATMPVTNTSNISSAANLPDSSHVNSFVAAQTSTYSGSFVNHHGVEVGSQQQAIIGNCPLDSDQNNRQLFPSAGNSTNNPACQFDLESRSDSMSSNSLEYCPMTGLSNASSRSSSATGSTITPKKYHCDKCSKSFTRSDMLTRHRRLHLGDRPFQCTECKQEFSRSDHLSTHMRTHTGEKPYRCKLCSYTACRKDMITRHMKVHNRGPSSSVELMDSG